MTSSTVMLIDMGTTLIFDIVKKIQDANMGIIPEEEIDKLISEWQPLIDSITDKIEDL